MTMNDPIADMLTRIRNGLQARKESVEVPASKVKKAILDVLVQEGYINGYTEQAEGSNGHPAVIVELKYYNGQPVIVELQRTSRPGLRKYAASQDVPVIREGLGISVVSTSKGMMTDAQAREAGVGGEVMCRVF